MCVTGRCGVTGGAPWLGGEAALADGSALAWGSEPPQPSKAMHKTNGAATMDARSLLCMVAACDRAPSNASAAASSSRLLARQVAECAVLSEEVLMSAPQSIDPAATPPQPAMPPDARLLQLILGMCTTR